jgi:LPS-assembly protein
VAEADAFIQQGTLLPTFLLSIILILVSWTPLLAAAPSELLLRADRLSHEQNDDVIRASGNVEIDWSGSSLYADMAEYYREKGIVTAKGSVKLIKGSDTLSGDSAEFEVNSKKGVVNNGNIFIKGNNLRLSGSRIEKSGDQDYSLQNGTITSCDGDKPSWKFKVDELKVTIDDFAYGRNALFYLNDIPVLWLPYLIFPAKTERQSGFLIPTAGNSSKKGVSLEIPFYWAISPSQDLTVTADLQSKRGFGAALEHRYLGLDKGYGTSKGYLIYDDQKSKTRGDIELKQQTNFTESTYWRADASLTLDRDFFRDYGTMSGDYNRQYLGTTAFLSHRSNDLLLTGGAEYIDNLDATNNSATLQKLPFITFNGTGRNLAGTPLYYSFATAVTNFDRDAGDRGQRMQLFPRLLLPVNAGDLFYGSVWGGYNQRFYSAVAAGEANGSSQRGGLEGGATLRTELSKVYDSPLPEFGKIRHLVAPELSYSLAEKRDQSLTPFFDYDDRPVGGQLVTFSLLNILTGRHLNGEQIEYRDLLRFTASQGYQLSGERRDLLTLVDYGHRFTDTKLMLELFPLPNWRLFADNRISPYNGNVTNSSFGAEAGDPKGTRASVNYHHAENLLDYIEGKATYADFRPYTFSASGRYSFDRPGFLETLYSLEYKHQCWGIVLSYRDRIDNKEFSFTFNLSGLGNLKLL